MKKFFLIVLGVVIIVAFAIFLAYKQTGEDVKRYSKSDANAPKAQVENSSFDFGILTSNEKQSHTFNLKNAGKSPLVLSNPKTSCDCTSVVIKINGAESPVFSMHTNKEWKSEVGAGKTADVVVIYDPTVHANEKGRVERIAFMQTNDPEQENLSFTISVESK